MIGKHATVVKRHDQGASVWYQATEVVRISKITLSPRTMAVRLENADYFTPTTKRRMNQAAEEFGLMFQVYQYKKKWLVHYFDVNGRSRTVPFANGMLLRVLKREFSPSTSFFS